MRAVSRGREWGTGVMYGRTSEWGMLGGDGGAGIVVRGTGHVGRYVGRYVVCGG